MGLLIKDYKVLKALMQHTYHPTLTALALWCSVRHSKFMITSAYRDDKGLHGLCRALDLRTRWFNKKDIDKLVDDINDYWEYDPKRPDMKCAGYHNKNHIHMKVHKRTEYHKEGREE